MSRGANVARSSQMSWIVSIHIILVTYTSSVAPISASSDIVPFVLLYLLGTQPSSYQSLFFSLKVSEKKAFDTALGYASTRSTTS